MTRGPDNVIPMDTSFCMVANDPASGEIAEIASLVRRTIAGDRSAFEQIILRYERRVLVLALNLLGTKEDAQDAAQEVFLRAFKYIHRLDLRRPAEPWLVRITVNVCRDIGRQRQDRRNAFPDLAVTEGSTGGQDDPHVNLTGKQLREMLSSALDELPEKERLAIILRDVDGLTTAQVAAALGSSEGTVRSQVSRARVRIRRTMERLRGGRP